jgi:hypothetical protein
MSDKQQPQKGRQRSIGQRASSLAAILLAIAAVAGWQYSKYANGYGLYRIFGENGGVVIATFSFAMVVFATIAVLREK